MSDAEHAWITPEFVELLEEFGSGFVRVGLGWSVDGPKSREFRADPETFFRALRELARTPGATLSRGDATTVGDGIYWRFISKRHVYACVAPSVKTMRAMRRARIERQAIDSSAHQSGLNQKPSPRL